MKHYQKCSKFVLTCKKVSLFTLWRLIKEVNVHIHSFLTWAFNGSKWLSFCSGCGSHWIGGWVGTRVSLGSPPSLFFLFWGGGGREKSLTPAGIRTPDHPVHTLLTIQTTLSHHSSSFHSYPLTGKWRT